MPNLHKIIFCFSVSMVSIYGANFKKCDRDLPPPYIDGLVAINPDTGRIVQTVRDGNRFQIWDLKSGALLDSQFYEETLGYYSLAGFFDSNKAVFYRRQNLAYAPDAAFTLDVDSFGIKTLWKYRQDVGPDVVSGLYWFSGYSSLLDLVSRKGIGLDQAPRDLNGTVAHKGTAFYGATNYPLQVGYERSIFRWDLPAGGEPKEVVSFKRTDVTSKAGARISVDELIVEGNDLLVTTRVDSDQVVLWFDLANGTQYHCPVPNFNDNVQIADRASKIVILQNHYLSYEGKHRYLDLRTCKVTDMPDFENSTFVHDGHRHDHYFLVKEVLGKKIFYNSDYIWDAATGKTLLKMCE